MSSLSEPNKKFVMLLSGGLDSPVSLYLLMNKGFDAIALSFLTGYDPESRSNDKIIKIASKISHLTKKTIKLYISDHNSTLETFTEKGLKKLTCIMCKRYMLHAARLLAIKENASFIANGDILGEQASQTLDNLVQVQKAVTDIPIIRPLIGFEKAEVIKLSQKLGLFGLSSLPAPPCKFNPKYPETHAKSNDVFESEKEINYDEIAQSILNNSKIISISYN
jgi:thiamine biosynthesis protein ThiI